MTKTQDKSNKSLTAPKLRIILSVIFAVTLIGMSAGFYFAYSFLQSKVEVVVETQAEASSSDAKLDNLIQLEKDLSQYEGTMEKAKQIASESKMYQYQNQIINDITSYADIAGVSIESFTFQDPTAPIDGAAPAAADAADPATEEGDQQDPAAATPVAPSLKSTVTSIKLVDEQNYDNILHFIYLIEQNITRMQILELNLVRDAEKHTVSAQSFNIEVYMR